MPKKITLTSRSAAAAMAGLAIVGAVLLRPSAPSAQRGAVPDGVTARAVAAAQAFLAARSTTSSVRAPKSALTPAARRIWSNLPTGVTMQVGATTRNGVKLGELNAEQQRAMLALVAAVLSPSGYQKSPRYRDGRRGAGTNERTEAARRQRGPLRPSRVLRGDPRHPVGHDARGCCSSAATIWR